jgi:hypothetical protein
MYVCMYVCQYIPYINYPPSPLPQASFPTPHTYLPTHKYTHTYIYKQYLEEFQRSEASGEWAFTMLRTPGSPAEARHFALQCLASLLTNRWKAWDHNVRKQFRVAVMELVEASGSGATPMEVFMRER